MALLKKSEAGKRSSLIKKPIQSLELTLPTVPSEPVHDFNAYHILIHGEKKIGKTTLGLEEEGVLLLTFDPLQNSLRVFQRHLPDWSHFMKYLELLETMAKSGKFIYRRIVVDGADIWYRRCQDWACQKLTISHPSEEQWGKGWDLLKSTFANAVDRLLALPCGVWFVCHSDWKEIETRKKNTKIQKLLPLLKAGGEEILVGRIDGWFAYDYVERQRVLIVKGDERTGAGHRIKGHFLTTKGEDVREIKMGESSTEAYKNLLNAFNNKQTYVDLEELEDSTKPAQPSTKKGGLLLKKK